MNYVKMKINSRWIYVAESRKQIVGEGEIVDRMKGSELLLFSYLNPLTLEVGPVLAADFVTNDSGTGLVHIAPGHGQDDYHLGLKYGIEAYSPVDASGRFHFPNSEFSILSSLHSLDIFKDGTHWILDFLAKESLLIHQQEWIEKKEKRKNSKPINNFLINTGSPNTFFCEKAMEALVGKPACNVDTIMDVMIHTKKVIVCNLSPHDKHFADVNVLGMDFLSKNFLYR
jgi:hypothetical protein